MSTDPCGSCRNSPLPGKPLCASCGYGYEGRINYVPMHSATWAGSTAGHEFRKPLTAGMTRAEWVRYLDYRSTE